MSCELKNSHPFKSHALPTSPLSRHARTHAPARTNTHARSAVFRSVMDQRTCPKVLYRQHTCSLSLHADSTLWLLPCTTVCVLAHEREQQVATTDVHVKRQAGHLCRRCRWSLAGETCDFAAHRFRLKRLFLWRWGSSSSLMQIHVKTPLGRVMSATGEAVVLSLSPGIL